MFTIPSVTSEVLTKLKTSLVAHGAVIETITPSITPGKYQIRDSNVLCTAQFTPSAGTLEVTIMKRPFFESEGRIERGLIEALVACGMPSPLPTPLAGTGLTVEDVASAKQANAAATEARKEADAATATMKA